MTQASAWTFSKEFQRTHPNIGLGIGRTNRDFLEECLVGSTLNVCAGYDNTGDVLVDLELQTLLERQSTLTHKVKIRADVENLPFPDKSFDTVICDPPYSFYGRHRWIRSLFDTARKRVILSTPQTIVRPPEGWDQALYYINSNHFFLRLWWVFTAR